MSILSFISSSNFIVVNKELIKQLGLEEAIIIGELASEYDYWNKREELTDGYFFSTIENVEESTGLSEFKQRKAIKSLKEKGFIDVKIKGVPAKRYIKINEISIFNLMNNQFSNDSRTSSLKIKELEVEKLKGNNNIYNKNNNNNISSRVSYKKEIEEIIDYMNNIVDYENLKSDKKFKFKSTSSANIKIITARLKEGYTVDEFKDVIFNCYKKLYEKQFKGKNGKSSKQYFVPTTIFTSSKMEQYLNEYENEINV